MNIAYFPQATILNFYDVMRLPYFRIQKNVDY